MANKLIKLFVEGTHSASVDAETGADTVGELREELSLSGTVSVNDIIATNSTSIDVGDRVSHVGGSKTGGQ
tara:strand:- start:8923 stop:9135 length:213 start_codon:yes stop_codon:yes gene_type:complete